MTDVTAKTTAAPTETETILAAMWRDLIGVPAVSADDDFFQLGATSLTAIKLLQRIEREFGQDALSPDELYEDARLRSVARAIDAAG